MRRSYLYAPGSRQDLMSKALKSDADAVVFDLEDAVSVNAKVDARLHINEITKSLGPSAKPIYIRVNADYEAVADLDALNLKNVTGIRIPKAQSPSLVRHLCDILSNIESKNGITPGTFEFEPLIESVSGLFNVRQMVEASNRVKRFGFGAGDFVNDLNAKSSKDRSATFLARAMLVLESKNLKLEPPISHVYAEIDELENLVRISEEDRILGFQGRSCIHPKQLSAVNRCFSYSVDEIERAREIVAEFETNAHSGIGAFVTKSGIFVDEAIAKRARTILGGPH